MNRKAFSDLLKNEIVVLDGSTGVELQKRGMPTGVCPEQWIVENPEILMGLQREYVAAGARIIYAPTFGANRFKLESYALEKEVERLNIELVKISKEAANGKAYVAGNLTITGKSIYPLSEYRFEDFVEVYKEQVRALLKAEVDLFVIETMISVQEARAALLAVKESCDLPVMVSMTFEEDGRTLNGSDPVTALITLQNLGADVVGCNCSSGPDDMVPIIQAMKPYAKVPLIAKPNAGLPALINGKTVFDMDKETFVKYALKLVEEGANVIGGCCGSDPSYIALLSQKTVGKKPALINKSQGSILSSEREFVTIGNGEKTIVVGERINPTGKKKLQGELKEGHLDYIIKIAKAQIEQGASVLDVNVGMNGIDEVAVMEEVVANLSTAVSAPLCIDSSNIEAIKAGLRVYPGRALVNSISLETAKIKELLPIAAKYGAMFILLPLSDEGLPKSLEEKHEIIRKVYEQAKAYGYTKEDVVVDGLVITIASKSSAAKEVFSTLQYCRDEFGCNTIMGLSNISFGLPERQFVNTAFLAMSITNGLTMAIANPSNDMFMNIMHGTDLLMERDIDAIYYINHFNQKQEQVENTYSPVYNAVLEGEKESVVTYVKAMLEEGLSPREIVDDHIITAITEVGEKFETKEYFLPQLIRSAETMEKAMKLLEPLLFANNSHLNEKKATVIMATVRGDVHDIGKNLVVLMLKNHGFEVIDLGKDVDREVIINKAKEVDADIIGLSALMTTTMVEMKEVIRRVNEEGLRAKVMIGGAVITQAYADEIHANYSTDANEAVKLAKKLVE
jgi:5-methyltetrahydrofolate--homocysteine methyltransferase